MVLLKIADRLKQLEWFPLLVVRISVGLAFFMTGKGKLGNLARVTEYFASLKIPMPGLNAAVAATTECVGGLLLMLGLGTRFVSPPLAFTMLVATLTAKIGSDEWTGAKGGLAKLTTLFGFQEWLYMIIFGWFIFAGAGQISIDHLVRKKLEAQNAR